MDTTGGSSSRSFSRHTQCPQPRPTGVPLRSEKTTDWTKQQGSKTSMHKTQSFEKKTRKDDFGFFSKETKTLTIRLTPSRPLLSKLPPSRLRPSRLPPSRLSLAKLPPSRLRVVECCVVLWSVVLHCVVLCCVLCCIVNVLSRTCSRDQHRRCT